MKATNGAVLTEGLLSWYYGNKRALPWRAASEEPPDPYRIWLSEVMLQQTTVAAVRPYYARFIALWPNVFALADAGLESVLEVWAGLGYYARARNLHGCAQVIARNHQGRFPDTTEALQALPGIGSYTASAIAAIAFSRPVAVVDGNVKRVMCRFLALRQPAHKVAGEIATRVQELVPTDAPGDFAQGLMELGALVCKPRRPDCGACPWAGACRARREGLTTVLPVRAKKATKPRQRTVAFWLMREDGNILLRRRPAQGILGGMLEVPSSSWREQGEISPDPEGEAPLAADWRPLSERVIHEFTHFRLEVTVWRAEAPMSWRPPASGHEWLWAKPDMFSRLALPSVMRKVAALALRAAKA